MSYHQLLNHLEDLGLKNMREQLPEYLDTIIKENMSFVDALSELAQKELAFRKEERDSLRLQRANLPFQKRVIDFDFNFQPQINKSEILDLCSLRFMDTADNLLFIGNSGVGKTHLTISIALEAMEKEKSCYFALSNELVDRLLKAHKRGTLENTLKKYTGYDVLIIDEVGYLPFSQDGANLLFQLINRRYEKKSTIITTNIPLSQWATVFKDKKLTNAIIDRLIHHSKIIQINGKSYRMKDYKESK
ncbi:TPA: ATP-binding protein [Enterococcus faecium]|uniref:IS21-like element helper ATPase IstB n=1 Tax=Enterococcus faecium TaxID=1352 RepID=UPI0002A23587|nr:IS21-like element helper ATPase IstB [Enterococcus faecium]VTQ71327.1 insertion sequenceputative ATP-binding protein [Enterococcus hirae]ELA82020.1 transposase helper protein [Enterococcus faecium EnGen0016]EZP89836.1 ATPase AAA [Enterococcus faecium VRE1044]EZP95837.1 ATPase AAA [Enterococcus faecium VRE1261]KWX94041.1 transposase [Enterococcus faecium]